MISGLAPVLGRIPVWEIVEESTVSAVMGRNASPVVSGEKPRFCCMKYVRNRNAPRTPAPASTIDA